MDQELETSGGIFGLCSVAQDDKTIHPSSEAEELWCCLKTCRPLVEYCYDYCRQNNKEAECYRDCDRMLIECENRCSISNNMWREQSPIVNCITEHGCGEYPNYDIECIRKNEDVLLQCCDKQCNPSSVASCSEHCRLKYLDLVEKSQDPLINVYYSKGQQDMDKEMYKEDNSWKYYLVAVPVILIILAILWFQVEKTESQALN